MRKRIYSAIDWRIFRILFLGGILGILGVLPLMLTIQGVVLHATNIPLPLLMSLQVLQLTVILAVVLFVGLFLSKKMKFTMPVLERIAARKEVRSILPQIIFTAVLFGIAAGVLIVIGDIIFAYVQFLQVTGGTPTIGPNGDPIPIADYSFGAPSSQVVFTPPAWQGFLASFYGGIFEEILLRLFLMSLLVWLFHKLNRFGNDRKPTNTSVWLSIVLASVLFGILHLPITATLTIITPIIVWRAIILNGIGGLIFGWLYWKKGLESAMIAHFSADIFLFVLLPFLF